MSSKQPGTEDQTSPETETSSPLRAGLDAVGKLSQTNGSIATAIIQLAAEIGSTQKIPQPAKNRALKQLIEINKRLL